MVNINQYLTDKTNVNDNRDLPFLNSLFVDRFSALNPTSKDNDFKTYMQWARKSPHLMGFINIIATDILSDRIDFIPLDKSSSRNKILKAKKFWSMNKGLEINEETIYDLLITGIGYNWVGRVDNDEIKELMEVSLNEMYPEIKSNDLEMKAKRMTEIVLEDNPNGVAKKLRHVASTTMSVHTDQYEVLNYIQRVGVNYKEYSTKEILAFKLMPLDGKIYPYPPMEALLSEVYLLWLITQNYVSFFENGGKPDNVFILPKEIAGSQNHKYLIETLKKYKKIQNKHGNLVFTGDLSVEKLQAVEQQMENKDLGLYLVGVLAMMYGVPVNRIPFLVGKAANNGDSGGLADSGYWRKISVWQSKIEETYNQGLFIPDFGVEMKFKRGYLQDEVRETQNEMQKTSIVEQRLRLGLMTVEGAGIYLGIDEEEIRKAQKEKEKRMEEEMKSGMMAQNLEKDKNVIPNEDNRLKRSVKQETQRKNQNDAGGKKINV